MGPKGLQEPCGVYGEYNRHLPNGVIIRCEEPKEGKNTEVSQVKKTFMRYTTTSVSEQ